MRVFELLTGLTEAYQPLSPAAMPPSGQPPQQAPTAAPGEQPEAPQEYAQAQPPSQIGNIPSAPPRPNEPSITNDNGQGTT